MRDEVVSHLAKTPLPSASETERPCLVGVAGTVTTLAAMAQDLRSYDPALVHGYRLTKPVLEKQLDRLRTSTQKEREAMAGLDPRRADVILSGAIILSEIARRAGGNRVGSPPALPAADHRGRVWEPSEGSHIKLPVACSNQAGVLVSDRGIRWGLLYEKFGLG